MPSRLTLSIYNQEYIFSVLHSFGEDLFLSQLNEELQIFPPYNIHRKYSGRYFELRHMSCKTKRLGAYSAMSSSQ